MHERGRNMKENPDKENSNEKVEKKDSAASSTDFLGKLNFTQMGESDVDKGNKSSKDQVPEHDDHAFPMMGDFLKSDKLKDVRSRKSKLLMVIGIFAGAFLMGVGAFMITVSPERVADNAELGDTASFSVFLMLIGTLLVAGSLASKFLDKSFFKGINSEIESGDETSSNSTKKNIKGDNINRNNR